MKLLLLFFPRVVTLQPCPTSSTTRCAPADADPRCCNYGMAELVPHGDTSRRQRAGHGDQRRRSCHSTCFVPSADVYNCCIWLSWNRLAGGAASEKVATGDGTVTADELQRAQAVSPLRPLGRR
ncbi:hypothetical protein VPH35_138293 [Triticum aestivum]